MDVEQIMNNRINIEQSSRRQEWQLTGDPHIDSCLGLTKPPTRCSANEYKHFVNDMMKSFGQLLGLRDTQAIQ